MTRLVLLVAIGALACGVKAPPRPPLPEPQPAASGGPVEAGKAPPASPPSPCGQTGKGCGQ